MLSFRDGAPFSAGRATFFDHEPAAREETAKIFVKIEPESLGGPILAQLDTGSAWSILDRQVAEELHVLGTEGETVRMDTRFGEIVFRLIPMRIVVLADEGDSQTVNASVCVSERWNGGTFLGYSGFLERLRFALDPQSNDFHFGGYVDSIA